MQHIQEIEFIKKIEKYKNQIEEEFKNFNVELKLGKSKCSNKF